MPVPAWIDRVAADLLDAESELRPLLRALRHHHDADTCGPPHATTRRARFGRAVTISEHEARTLLRASMPAPVTSTRLRQPHARMVAALGLFTAHVLTLNDPLTDPQHAIGAAVQLLEELRAWLAVARWTQACRAAGVRWPVPADLTARVAGTTLLRQQAPGQGEQTALDLAAVAEAHRTAAAGLGHQTARTTRRRAAAAAAAADLLTLAAESTAPPPPTVLPLRRR